MKELSAIQFKDIEWSLRVVYGRKVEDPLYCDIENKADCVHNEIERLLSIVDVNREIAEYLKGSRGYTYDEAIEKITEILDDKSSFEIFLQIHFESQPFSMVFTVENRVNIEKILSFLEVEGVKS